jgi:hypothetical protein
MAIGLQDSRHTAAIWLDHSGVARKVASVFMGHKAPRAPSNAAPIALRRYTHVAESVRLVDARVKLPAYDVPEDLGVDDDPVDAAETAADTLRSRWELGGMAPPVRRSGST